MRVCVFCGSSRGVSPAYAGTAADLDALAARGAGLVYGGSDLGLMGVVALLDGAVGAATVEGALALLEDPPPPPVHKWIERSET